MMLGKIIGKITTSEFKFRVEKETKKFEYVQVFHKLYEFVLCQVLEIEKQEESTTAFCQVIGYKEKGKIKKPMIPFDPESEVLLAEDDLIKQIIQLEDSKSGALIGKLDGREINVYLDLNKILSLHLAVLAKSGSGKSYAVGVLLEEMVAKKIPVLVIDPHGEYSSLKQKNNNKEDKEKLKKYDLKPENFPVQEFGDTSIITGARPLKLNNKISPEELLSLLPSKLSSNQMAILYSSLKNIPETSFDSLLLALEQEESNTKFSVMSMIEYLKNLEIFTGTPTPYNELIKQGHCNIINLKGINPDVQELIVYKIAKDLFELRKKGKIPPFFLVIEEAHNYCPERSFGEAKSSKIIRNIASEGRKFGLGLCIISQRPARVDKSVLSQCTTQMILKVTNPNDLKAVSSSIEGLTDSTEKEIQNLPIGTAIITGLTEVPLIVVIRPRKSLHGGKAQEIITKEENFIEKMQDFQEEEMLPLIKPSTTLKDLELMSEKKIKQAKITLVPCYQFVCSDSSSEYLLLIEMINGTILTDKNSLTSKIIPDMSKLTKKQINILKYCYKKKSFTETEIIEKLGTDLEISQDLSALQKIGFLEKEKEKYKLSEKYAFTKLSSLQNFDKPTYEHIKYTKKMERKANLDDIIERISRFTNIKDKNECFLIKYELEF